MSTSCHLWLEFARGDGAGNIAPPRASSGHGGRLDPVRRPPVASERKLRSRRTPYALPSCTTRRDDSHSGRNLPIANSPRECFWHVAARAGFLKKKLILSYCARFYIASEMADYPSARVLSAGCPKCGLGEARNRVRFGWSV